MHRITIMSKPGCHLCEAALEVAQRVVGARTAVLIEEVDITQDLELLEKYGEAIPVVLVDGVERFRGTIDPDAFARLFYDEPGMGLTGIS
ncbi:MAG TPA: glutaredoxin family protein [Chthoniobacteraceae bacterium]|nr:glutaredoxin family protein [Phycisphaerae bacterium]HWB58684.1 glutaredoxin family protein [Chthoniobacteraceae bacterium]